MVWWAGHCPFLRESNGISFSQGDQQKQGWGEWATGAKCQSDNAGKKHTHHSLKAVPNSQLETEVLRGLGESQVHFFTATFLNTCFPRLPQSEPRMAAKLHSLVMGPGNLHLKQVYPSSRCSEQLPQSLVIMAHGFSRTCSNGGQELRDTPVRTGDRKQEEPHLGEVKIGYGLGVVWWFVAAGNKILYQVGGSRV